MLTSTLTPGPGLEAWTALPRFKTWVLKSSNEPHAGNKELGEISGLPKNRPGRSHRPAGRLLSLLFRQFIYPLRCQGGGVRDP